MRASSTGALAIICALSASPSTLHAQLKYDPSLGQAIDTLPEIEVVVPTDRTEFTTPGQAAVPSIDLPALPPVVVTIPERPFPPVLPPPAIASPAPVSPKPVIVMVPEAPAAKPPVTSRPAPLSPLPAPLPASSPSTGLTALGSLDTPALDSAFNEIGKMQALPAGVLDTLRSYYSSRNGAALWTSGETLTPAARAVLALIERADEHGLEPRRSLALRTLVQTGTPALKDAALSVAAVQYARDARGARVNPLQVSRLITATPSLPEAWSVLKALDGASAPAAVLEGYHPRHAGYHALKARLAGLRKAPVEPDVYNGLTHGQTLRIGMVDDRVPLLRDLLGLPAAAHMRYDRALADAVKAAQAGKGLPATGKLDAATVAALGGPPATLISRKDAVGDIIANMERWRWLPEELGTEHVFVNIPSFALTFQRNGARVFQTRVIVGKPQTPTPIFSDRMQFLVVNPYWNVPPSIALKEMLPLLQKNPHALQARGLQVVRGGKVVDPSTIDWASSSVRSVAIRQPPGERNALGHIKFMFPNEHAVYLHDTPSRGLFSRPVRAFSHGCVRVENPFSLADALLGEAYSERQLKAMIGGPERNVRLDNHIPVHLAYFTTFVDEAGEVIHYPDLYGHNRRLKNLLGV